MQTENSENCDKCLASLFVYCFLQECDLLLATRKWTCNNFSVQTENSVNCDKCSLGKSHALLRHKKKKNLCFHLPDLPCVNHPTLVFLSVNKKKKKITAPDHTKFPVLRFFFVSLSKLSCGPETTRCCSCSCRSTPCLCWVSFIIFAQELWQ